MAQKIECGKEDMRMRTQMWKRPPMAAGCVTNTLRLRGHLLPSENERHMLKGILYILGMNSIPGENIPTLMRKKKKKEKSRFILVL